MPVSSPPSQMTLSLSTSFFSSSLFARSELRCSFPAEHPRLVLRVGAKASAQQLSGSRTCKNCKKSFDAGQNNPRACRFHTAHFGGETKRKFESVHTGGTMDTIGGGEIVQYWHCCGSKDPFDIGCEAAPHQTYDD